MPNKAGTQVGRRRGADIRPETIAAIRRMRLEEGKSVTEVAAAFGIGPGTVSQYASTKPRTNPERDAVIIGMAREGKPQSAIIEATGLHYTMVSDTVRWAAVQGYVTKRGLKLSAGPVPFPPVVVTRKDGQSGAAAKSTAPAPKAASEVSVPSPKEIARVLEDKLTQSPSEMATTTRVFRLGSAPTPHEEDTERRSVTLVGDQSMSRASLRTRLLAAIAASGPFPDTEALMRTIRQPDDNYGLHEVQSILGNLNQQGLIKYRTKRTGSQKLYQRIESTRRGYEQAGLGTVHQVAGSMTSRTATPLRRSEATDFRTHGGRAVGGEVIKENYEAHRAQFPDHNHPPLEEAQPVAKPVEYHIQPYPGVPVVVPPEPEPPVIVATDTPAPYPFLALLRQRRADKKASAGKAAKYLEAAAILEAIDPVESQRLMAQAETLDGEPFTALEAEYLAFADACDGR